VVYLDAILYLGGGIVGAGHHWYWTGPVEHHDGAGRDLLALEVVPLTLLTLDAWDFHPADAGTCATLCPYTERGITLEKPASAMGCSPIAKIGSFV